MYSTIIDADTYFTEKLHALSWTEASDSNKTKAMNMATAIIDRLQFSGWKVEDTQVLEFPRYYGDEPDGTETIPDDINIACYEIAYSLLDGVDPDKEYANLAVKARTFSSVSTTYDTNAPLDYLACGVPSIIAWRYLLPYLANTDSIRIYRKS